MTRILLTGAGFSRNWGGWLANEVFEYLLGTDIGVDVRRLLWRDHGGGIAIENTLASLQQTARGGDSTAIKQLKSLQDAIIGMFNQMNTSFAQKNFELSTRPQSNIRPFLARFDALFTLNQDLLIELHYFGGADALYGPPRWDGVALPGIKPLHPQSAPTLTASALHTTGDLSALRVDPRIQPYIKLHGSSNWVENDGSRILIMGGGKSEAIARQPLLNRYHQLLREYLNRPDVRLMIIGYSFGDHHINELLEEGAATGNLQISIIDPRGVDALDTTRERTGQIRTVAPLVHSLGPHVIGASRRSLSELFGGDGVEYGKVMKFFDS